MTNDADVFDALKYRVEVDHRGTRRYFNSNNQLHRENGPAIEYADGSQCWCRDNALHREDGPAVMFVSGRMCWYLYGEELTELGYRKRLIELGLPECPPK